MFSACPDFAQKNPPAGRFHSVWPASVSRSKRTLQVRAWISVWSFSSIGWRVTEPPNLPFSANLGIIEQSLWILHVIPQHTNLSTRQNGNSSIADRGDWLLWQLLMTGWFWPPAGCSCCSKHWPVCHTVAGRCPLTSCCPTLHSGYAVQSSGAFKKSMPRGRRAVWIWGCS